MTGNLVLVRPALALAFDEKMIEARKIADRDIGVSGEGDLESSQVRRGHLVVPASLQDEEGD